MSTDNSKKAPDTDFYQQRLPSLAPRMTPSFWLIFLLALTVIFLPTGIFLVIENDKVHEQVIIYDGRDNDVSGCHISTSNQGTTCNFNVTLSEDMDGPIFVYYELQNYFANHNRYVRSKNIPQLMGDNLAKGDVELTCNPLTEIVDDGQTLLLNPCGLIPNSLFNDIIMVGSRDYPNLVMQENDITLKTDRDIYSQVNGFQQVVDDADTCTDNINLPNSCWQLYRNQPSHCFAYPNCQTTRYLYQSYPNIIDPLVGVEDEHFIVWMRTAGLPKFRNLYGRIEDINMKRGDTLSFTINNNFEVRSFGGTKSIILSTVGLYGGNNDFSGVIYILVGCFCFVAAVILAISLLFKFKIKAE